MGREGDRKRAAMLVSVRVSLTVRLLPSNKVGR